MRAKTNVSLEKIALPIVSTWESSVQLIKSELFVR